MWGNPHDSADRSECVSDTIVLLLLGTFADAFTPFPAISDGNFVEQFQTNGFGYWPSFPAMTIPRLFRGRAPAEGRRGHKASATPQQSSGLLQSDAGMFSTSGDSRSRPDRPTSSILCACRARTARGMALDYTPR